MVNIMEINNTIIIKGLNHWIIVCEVVIIFGVKFNYSIQ